MASHWTDRAADLDLVKIVSRKWLIVIEFSWESIPELELLTANLPSDNDHVPVIAWVILSDGRKSYSGPPGLTPDIRGVTQWVLFNVHPSPPLLIDFRPSSGKTLLFYRGELAYPELLLDHGFELVLCLESAVRAGDNYMAYWRELIDLGEDAPSLVNQRMSLTEDFLVDVWQSENIWYHTELEELTLSAY